MLIINYKYIVNFYISIIVYGKLVYMYKVDFYTSLQ